MIGKKFRFDITLHDEAGDMKKNQEAGLQIHDQEFLRINHSPDPSEKVRDPLEKVSQLRPIYICLS
jgi:hypothetical protein